MCLPPRNPLGLCPSFPGTRWNFGSRTRPPLQSRNSLWHDPSPFSLSLVTENLERKVTGSRERPGFWAVPGVMNQADATVPVRHPGDRGGALPGAAPRHPLTTGIAPQRGTASLGTGAELMALRVISGYEMVRRGFWDSLQDGKGPPWRKSGGSLHTVVGFTSWRNNLWLGNELFILPPNCRSISFFISRNMKKKKEITRKPWIHEIHLESK